MVFGSLTRRGAFTPWSDLDLAASGIPPDQFYTAVAAVAGLSPELKVDLVDADRCPARIRSRIDLEAREV
jgi:predicted nucleotidyltransferase